MFVFVDFNFEVLAAHSLCYNLYAALLLYVASSDLA